ncbi:MAG TPA: glutamate-1-semialdehyde 2,1-aminomutase, partial [Roseateles sp.]|nr:glutamate-1-semialdehyde 2,1-aminomutase [Roseateles sp.]
MDETLSLYALAALALAGLIPKAKRRLELSRAKHRSLAGHARIAKRIAAQVPGYAYDEARFFAADGAPPELAQRRSAGFHALARALAEAHPRSIAATEAARAGISDLQFTGAYRVPYQFSPYLRRHLKLG